MSPTARPNKPSSDPSFAPSMVKVLPLPVCPKAKTDPLPPCRDWPQRRWLRAVRVARGEKEVSGANEGGRIGG
eukprot:2432220-Rhodomonas_salina.1